MAIAKPQRTARLHDNRQFGELELGLAGQFQSTEDVTQSRAVHPSLAIIGDANIQGAR